MALQQNNTNWIYLDRATAIWREAPTAAQGLFQPIHWVALHRMEAMVRALPHDGLLADIGCSYGVFTANLAFKKPRAKVIGIDPDESRLVVGNQLLMEHSLRNCSFQKGTVDETGLEPESCTGVICTETLDHIQDIKPRLKETVENLFGLLKPGGRLLMSILSEHSLKEAPPDVVSPLTLEDFDFLENKSVDLNCPRWWHLFHVTKPKE